MKRFKIPMVVTSLVGLCLLAGLEATPARADFVFGNPVNLGPTVNDGRDQYGAGVSADGLEFYFFMGIAPTGVVDLYVTTRQTPDDAWGPPAKLGPTVNDGHWNESPCLSQDGLSLYFGSNRPNGYGSWDLYVTTRATKKDAWGPPVNLGPNVNSRYCECIPRISADGLSLFFSETDVDPFAFRPGGHGGTDLWVSTRPSTQAGWGVPVNLGPPVNTGAYEACPWISDDGLTLLFGRGSAQIADIMLTRRKTKADPWQTPVNLGPLVNSATGWENFPCISGDGSILYFVSFRPGGFGYADLWQAPIIPTLDFNGDGKVNAKDMDLLTDNWGKNTTLCDIGPFAWGDGVVDEKDVGALMKSLVTPSPRATDVACDVVLNWTLPSFAQACDVYLGTSQEAVTNASRTDSQGVLVSQGQTAMTYDPAGLLDLSRTYYWRVDFVSADAAPVIYQGPVLQFTTGALTYPLKNITATASSAQAGSGPERTVDGSGLDKSDGHSTDVKDMWWTLPTSPHWIQYEFDQIYTLHEMWVWNFNMAIEPLMGFGAKTVKIEYSTDGTTWTPLANVPEFAQAPGQPGYTANTIVSFAAVPAKFVKLTIEKNWGVAPQTGLSEVRFFCIQTAAVQ